MSAKEIDNIEVRADTFYWGYRELEAHELQYVAGGDSSDGEAGSEGGEAGLGGPSPGGLNSDAQAANPGDKQYCMTYCSTVALPSGNFGWAYFNCLNNCLAGSGSSNSASSGYCNDGSN
jgi:hypothetical protein